MQWEYLLILLLFTRIIFFVKLRYHIRVYKNTQQAVLVTLFFFIIGIAWDTFAIWRGHWVFPDTGTLGIFIGNMPLEDYLFMLIAPFGTFVVYKLFLGKEAV